MEVAPIMHGKGAIKAGADRGITKATITEDNVPNYLDCKGLMNPIQLR